MTRACIEPEILAAFAEGKLTRGEIAPLLDHLAGCERCASALQSATDVYHAESAPPRRTWWVAAAAAMLIAVIALPFFIARSRHDGVARLAALSPRDARIIEPRLSGGFDWAAYHGPDRGDSETRVLKLNGEAAEVIEHADKDRSPDAQHAAGVAYVLVNDPMRAIERLQAAAEAAPRDANVWNDLAAARYAAAERLGRASLYPEALTATDRALAADARNAEALFNRALILEKLGLTAQAREAWQRFLAVDSSSPWAVEARERLSQLPMASSESLFRGEVPRLDRAAMSGDVATVASLVARFPQQCRTSGEVEYLGHWGMSLRNGDGAEARRQITIARAIGDALAAFNGETLLRDAVQSVDANGSPALAEAHAAYYAARLVYSHHEPARAEPELRRAASLFAGAKSPMALVARYFAANTRFDQNDTNGARRELEPLLAEADARGYAALGAQVRWELALCATIDNDLAGALPPLRAAEETFHRLGESGYEGFITAILAQTNALLGRPDDAWAAWIRCFTLLSREARGDRLPVTITGAVVNDVRTGHRESALALLHLAGDTARASGNQAVLTSALLSRALLESDMGEDDAARRTITEMQGVTAAMSDPALREKASNDLRFASAAADLRGDAPRAAATLTTAIDKYNSMSMALMLPEPLLLRARARLRSGDVGGAAADLDEGIATLERHRVAYAGSVAGTGMIDVSDGLFDEAVSLAAARGDREAAFAYAERERAQFASGPASPIGVKELQQRLAGSSVAVLELVTTPDEVIALTVTERECSVARTKIARAELDSLITGESWQRLFDVLIRPSLPQLDDARSLIVVPDAVLRAVPFAALEDGKEPLVARLPVAIALRAALLERHPYAVPKNIAAMTLPSGDGAGTIGLPETSRELQNVVARYPASTTIDDATFEAMIRAARGAAVVHIAGHTQREQGAGEAALVFAPRHRVSWAAVAAARLGNPDVVVLAACETLRAAASPRTRALSLADGFAAAGARDVVGTLAPIPDRDARELFAALHGELAAGVAPAAALRNVQLAAMANERSGRARAWRALEVLTTRIP